MAWRACRKWALAFSLSGLSACALAGEWSGFVSVESWYFPDESALQRKRYRADVSLAAQPQYFRQWDDRRQTFRFTGFLRIDEEDDERTHIDVRELEWIRARADYEWRLGVRKLFWGVTEFAHLVDIINQTDFVEDPDGEEKLGQPMVSYALVKDWGTLEFFALLGFRERTFPCLDCRFQTDPPIDPDSGMVEDEDRIDWGVRWSHVLGVWDIGIYYFKGISRDPRFIPGSVDGRPVLVPLYELIEQIGLDLQATTGNWLWKLEAFSRSGQGSTFRAATAGFEYTFVGIADSPIDLGVLAEYIWDERDEGALTPFENDLGIGLRLTFNDAQSTSLLLGVIADVDKPSRVWQLEAKRRLWRRWTLSVESRIFRDIDPDDFFLFAVRDSDFIRVELARFF